MIFANALALLVASQFTALAGAQSSCPSPSGGIRPSVASGYALQVVATGLSRPRGIAFDSAGHLLVVEQGTGTISSHVLNEANGCVTIGSSSTVVQAGLALNHGIQINGTTLYASNPQSVYSWTYDPASGNVSNQQELINNMNNSDHSTRTLLVSQQMPGLLVVSRGSTSNLDLGAASLDSGRSQVRVFNLANRTSIYNYDSDGLRLAWGVRNEVGIGEHPATGGLWGVENSADQITRMGVDVSNDNPGEELNFFGYLNGTSSANQGGNFGYPWCLSVWNRTELPNNSNLTVGQQFAFDGTSALNNQNRTDAFCAQQVQSRLVFAAHMAPLDIKFNNSGTEAWITFHGSWDRQVPIGYKLSVVQFRNGEPTEPSTSLTAATDIISNQNNNACPDSCFRPVAMAFDSQGRIFMSSDASGEIYMVTRTASSNGTGTSTGSSSSPSATGSTSTGAITFGSLSIQLGAILALAFFKLL
ncbi:hypothetical protein H2198_007893 [Neophaeococcomyces mojaviensis]|uniref:Uncharacterized protein n=1 Tax=Neophaeococcomyces mojaviensis TaxID=3383035 RepID=A0ACC2ZYQ8_9EURO|nr:hypothetical protein H2198_007893 [Knufia sp. JES_112]